MDNLDRLEKSFDKFTSESADSHLRVEHNIDLIKERIASIDTTLSVNTESLREHIRRTALIEADLIPIKKHVNIVSFILKTVGVLISGGLLTYLLGHFFK
jgi:hypothetical protein